MTPAPGTKLDYKLRWLQHFALHSAELLTLDVPVIIAGDYKVIPTEIDVDKPERWQDDALFRRSARAESRCLLLRSTLC